MRVRGDGIFDVIWVGVGVKSGLLMKTKSEPNYELTSQIIAASIEVHRRLGPGLLESAYEACLLYELHKRGLKAISQVAVPIIYDEVKIDVGYRIDLLVEGSVLIELKSVEKVIPLYEAQVLSYLKSSGHQVGLLINFNVTRLKDGITRLMN